MAVQEFTEFYSRCLQQETKNKGRDKQIQSTSPVDIEGVLQLLGEGLHLGALLQQLAAQAVHLVLQDVNVGHTVLQDVQLPPGLSQLQLQQPQLIQPVTQPHLVND